MRQSCEPSASFLQSTKSLKSTNNSPLDAPESIKELALRPLIPKLLLRLPFSDLAAVRISLFRCMTGVSAIGNVIFVPDDSGETKPFRSSVFDLLGLPFLRFFSAGTASGWSCFRDDRRVVSGCGCGCGCGSGSGGGVFLFPRVWRFGRSSMVFSFVLSSNRLLDRRPFLGDGCGGDFSGAELGTSGIASIDGLAFLDGRRLN